ncbi:MAG: hypothetical protein ABI684_13320 [Nitrospirota bacterium]
MGKGNADADEAVLNMLQRHEVLTMDDLIINQPDFSWAQVFLAVDRLSRNNLVALRRIGLNYQMRRMDRVLPLSQNQHHEEPVAAHRR